ncbi:hypothetical protein SAMN02745215_05070 [Desulfitobacterium chlororespirans DSM 11544]|uniref:Mu-like prophage protein Com n=1 Tax=Desulfitobacterium chlororespirans DSM 11544 TaxID=1121395 RepID=A0A1M7UYE7_9FIRM|nr:hypothetical protein SAMN02745215_05070 [Desulfitobacterium chlororespirans DSM 11544]
MNQVRCPSCGKLLAEYELQGSMSIRILCKRCKKLVELKIAVKAREGVDIYLNPRSHEGSDTNTR